ncbi:MAG TPA: PHB depolymerase family esterase [Roseomonas sp.]|jgi:feruloyl esterase
MMNRRLDLSALVRLQRLRRHGVQGAAQQPHGDGRLTEVMGFGSNPGGLRMLAYVPKNLPKGAPLVVALHGCTQTAAAYDQGSGWSTMADQFGFALLLPEQRRANNPNLCFNWFEPGDIARDAGEALSIRQMVGHMLREHGLDASRVFVTGLSAGGAMTSVMLATYPEVFAGGAIVAGLPYGAGIGVAEALQAMARPADLPAAARGAAVRTAANHHGPWPRVAVWHGEADKTVHPDNASETLKQWLHLHGLEGAAPNVRRSGGGHAQRAWHGPDGVARVACHRIAGMAHGVPLRAGEGEGQCGVAGAYMLEVGVSSTHEILAFWGLETVRAGRRAEAIRSPGRAAVIDARAEEAHGEAPVAVARPVAPKPEAEAKPEAERIMPGGWPSFPVTDPGAVITRALQAAGLMGTDRG